MVYTIFNMTLGTFGALLLLLVAGFITKLGGGPKETDKFDKTYNPKDHM